MPINAVATVTAMTFPRVSLTMVPMIGRNSPVSCNTPKKVMAKTNIVAMEITLPRPSVKNPVMASSPKPASKAPASGTRISGRMGAIRPTSSSTTRLQMVNRPIRVNTAYLLFILVRPKQQGEREATKQSFQQPLVVPGVPSASVS